MFLQLHRQELQNSLADCEKEAMAKVLTSLSDDSSLDRDTFNRLKSDMASLATSGNPWMITMETEGFIIKATEMNQSLEKLKSQVTYYMFSVV